MTRDASRRLDDEMEKAFALTDALPENMRIAAIRARMAQCYELTRLEQKVSE